MKTLGSHISMKNKFYKEIDHLHLEVTSNCDASCPQCARNWWGSSHTPTEMYEGEFKKEWIKRFKPFNFNKITINGNYGDICAHSDPVGLIAAIKEEWPRVSLHIISAGYALTPEQWREIGGMGWIGKGCLPIQVDFGIDGVDQEIHSKYRRGTELDRVLENAGAFMEAGGQATWVMTEFEHNKHQVEEARYLAETMGFEGFVLRPSMRHHDNMPSPVVNDNADIIDWIGPPRNSNPNFEKSIKSIQRNLKIDHFKKNYSVNRTNVKVLYATAVDCWAQREKSIYVDAQGMLYPCGWLGKPITWKNTCESLKSEIGFNRTDDNSAISILQNEFWEKLANTTTDNSLSVCQRNCGYKSTYAKQRAESNVENFKDVVDIRL